MKRLLTAGIFGTILGIVGTGTANASIVSSGFLDEKLTEYALSTSLDLKANQTDLTALSNKIGTLPSAILPSMWTDVPYYTETGVDIPDAGIPLPTTIGEQLEFLLNAEDSPIDLMFRSIILSGDEGHYDNFLGLRPLTQRVMNIEENITLPSGEILPSKGLTFLLPEPPDITYPTSIRDFMTDVYNGYWSVSGLAEAVYHGNEIIGQQDPARIVKGLRQITDEIGTLPEGITVQGMYEGWTDSNKITYSGLNTISQDYAGILDAFGTSGLTSLFLKGGTITIPGYSTNTILPYPELSYGVSKIGTLPSGSLPTIPEHVVLFPELNQPLTYPTSLAELITALYGNSETDSRGLLAGILGGFPFDTDGDGQKESNPGILPNFTLANDAKNLANANATKIGTVPDGKNLAGMISETDAKIGTLPAGYDSIGAALTAIKGIAEDAKAAALAAIPDPKQEGSSGKFVLTVDIVGDNATYHWEKIDREGETTTTE